MSLSEDLGLGRFEELDEETSQAQFSAIKGRMLLMAKAEVGVPYEEWVGWHPLEQIALAEASEIVAAERAVDFAHALSGGSAEVLGVADGGAAQLRQSLESMSSRIATLSGKTPRR